MADNQVSGPGDSSSRHRGHAFISYVREDSREVDVLQRELEAARVPVWRDTSKLWPGEDWRAKIRQAITDDALVFIACFSARSAARKKSYQYEELLLAIEQMRCRQPGVIWLIPVRFDEGPVPEFDLGGGRTLRSLQQVDLYGANRDTEVRRLIAAVQRLLRGDPAASAADDAVADAAAYEALSRGLVASYRLNETTGRMTADEVGGHLLKLSGTVEWNDSPGSGLVFVGQDDVDCVSDHLIATDSSFSVSAWVMLNPGGRGYWRTAVAQDGDGYSGFYLQYSALGWERTWAFALPENLSWRVAARTGPRTGEWVHLVGVHDAVERELRLYVDGQREGRARGVRGLPSNGQFTIGRALYKGDHVDWFDGNIKLVKVWNRALSDAEVPVIARVEAGPC